MTKGGKGSYQKSAAKEAQKSEDSATQKKAAGRSKIMIDPLLVEIGIDSWRDLTVGREAIRTYLQREFGIIADIFADPLLLGAKCEYKAPESMDYKDIQTIPADQLSEANHLFGINRQVLIDELKKRSGRNLRYEEDRLKAYNVIRSTLPLVLDEILFQKEEFSSIKNNDPIGLWDLVSATVMSRKTSGRMPRR